jgi:hypothetical protein
MTAVAVDLDSQSVGPCGNEIDLGAELDGLSIIQHMIGRRIRVNLKGLQGTKVDPHPVERVHGTRINYWSLL